MRIEVVRQCRYHILTDGFIDRIQSLTCNILHVSWFIPDGSNTVMEVLPPELYAVKKKDLKFMHTDQTDDSDSHLPW